MTADGGHLHLAVNMCWPCAYGDRLNAHQQPQSIYTDFFTPSPSNALAYRSKTNLIYPMSGEIGFVKFNLSRRIKSFNLTYVQQNYFNR